MIMVGDDIIDAVVFCEDIREETGGKFSLNGVMSSGVILPVLPSLIRFSIFLEFTPVTRGDRVIVLIIRIGGEDNSRIEGRMQAEVPGLRTPVPFAGLVGLVKEEGELTVDLAVNGGDATRILSRQITTLPNPASEIDPNASLPPG